MEYKMPEWRLRSRGEGIAFRRKTTLHGLYADCMIEQGVTIFHEEKVQIGSRTYIAHNAILHGHPNGYIKIGKRCWIGFGAMLFGHGGLRIEDDVGIGAGVVILTSTHEIHSGHGPIIHRPQTFDPVHIRIGVDIGSNAVIMPGVFIGPCAQIGAGAVVTRDVPDREIWAGVPATKIGEVVDDTR